MNDFDDVPIAITVEPTKRPLEWVDLIGVRYPVRRPKTIVAGEPKAKILRLAAFIDQQSPAGVQRAQRRAAKGQTVPRLEMSVEEQREAMHAVWRYLRAVLDDEEDYAAIRRRLYGDVSDEEALAASYLEFEEDPNPSDDIDVDNVVLLVANLIAYWGESGSVRTSVKAPGRARAQQSGQQHGQTTKRPARRPSGHHAKQAQG